ncbi:TolB family protein [Amycolatopsis suaedae]|uniref:TolB-like translocation protein n=1 Tax=Amycolatopsis suaedae TaxID=2510978 RepID=A0A4Q7JGD0_9PSEU|nr:hypothetical protein EWH70_01745 [Amycolatopsis suaedae]
MKGRIAVALGATLALAGAAVTYTVSAMGHNPDQQQADASVAVDRSAPADLAAGRLLFRNEAPGPDHGKVASVAAADPGGPRRVGSLDCRRFYASAGTGLCLAEAPGPLPSAVAVVVGRDLAERRRVDVAGIPNRAKLSADGRMASWTTFVTGDSYTQGNSFSTRTAILDLTGDELLSNIEDLPLTLEGKIHSAEDVNYWGVTFAADDRRFYATVSTAGRTHLVRGDFTDWRGTTLRDNLECPSLSPDGTRLAFKKRIAQDGARPWREYVLDLATMRETPLAETRSIDDQVIWLDDHTIAYGLPGEGGRTDVWAVPADGSGTPRLLVPYASSPSVST